MKIIKVWFPLSLNLIDFHHSQRVQVSPEAKRRAAEAKSRGDEAFRRREYRMAVDAYTQVQYTYHISFAKYRDFLVLQLYFGPIVRICKLATYSKFYAFLLLFRLSH